MLAAKLRIKIYFCIRAQTETQGTHLDAWAEGHCETKSCIFAKNAMAA